MLNYVLKMQGSKRVTLGSDYPFPLGDLEIGEFINKMQLDENVVEDILQQHTGVVKSKKKTTYESFIHNFYKSLLLFSGFRSKNILATTNYL